MNNFPIFITLHLGRILVIACCFLFAISGCSLKGIHEQAKLADNAGYIEGNVELVSNQKGPVIILRYRDEKGVPVQESSVTASKKGDFKFSVLPGKYYIAAFIDNNGDGSYQPGEHGNYYGVPSIIDVSISQTIVIDTIEISGEAPKPQIEAKPVDGTKAIWKNIGQMVTFDDPRFTRDNYNMGLWKPFEFLDKAEGGLFFLNEYQQEKIPLLFVHGVLDGPTLWKQIVKHLDTQHFQPWFLYYPSGLRLDVISDYLVEAVTRLQRKHGFEKFYVVAHSMGGLVTRSFVKKIC